MELKIQDLQEVEKYIRGKLDQAEIEALWVRFLQDQKLFRYFMMEVQVAHLIKEVNAGKVESPFAE